jgi:amino acid adenylation domain-containing protein
MPLTPTEAKLAEIWRDVLQLETVAPDQAFLDVGGNSVKAAHLAAEIAARLGVHITLLDLFNAATIRQQAPIVQQKLLQRGAAPAVEEYPPIRPDPASQYEPFPLTDVQQAYWIGRAQMLELGGVSTYTYFEVETGTLDLPRLNAALNALIRRHPALRTRILPDGTQQVLAEIPPYAIREYAAHPQGSATVREQVRREMSHQVLPADQPPLFDIRAVHTPGGTRLHFGFDALCMDGWSRRLFFREWAALYADPSAPLEPLAVTFRDHVLAEHAFRQSARHARARSYWWARLDDFPAAPDLPLAIPPETLGAPHFTRRSHYLPAEKWERLQQAAAARGLTASVILAAAYADALRLWSRTPRFALNLTVFNRNFPHPHINHVIGDFTSLLLLAVEPPEPAASFTARAAQLQRQLLADFEHADVSAIEVLRELIRRRGLGSRAAQMPVVFTRYFDPETAIDTEAPEAWLGKTTFSTSQTPQVWLDLIVANELGSIALHLNAVDDLFPPGMAADLFAALARWLERLADDGTAWDFDWRAAAALLLPPAHAALQAAANATAAALPGSLLHELFAAQAARTPDAPAVITADRTLTYAELLSRARAIGADLRARGARPNRHVAIVMDKGWEQAAAALGVLFSGAAYLPIDPATPAERFHYILRFGQVDLALTQQHLLRGLDWTPGVTPIAISGTNPPPGVTDPWEPIQRPADLAYTIFTSGSTGLPKGVMIDHRGAVNTIQDLNARFGISARDRVLALSALTFDLSVYDIFGTLAAGGAIVMPEPGAARDPARWAQLARAHGVTLWNSVPALMSLLVEYMAGRAETLDTLRLVWLSGDWIPVNLPGKIRALCPGAQIISMGGATEASIWSIIYPIGEVPPDWTSIPYGKPMRNQHFYVLDHALNACPLGVPGDLYIGGAGLALGYWRDARKTAEGFVPEPHPPAGGKGARLYRTGDLGRWLPDGNIEFLGRADFQVKVQGFRVELGEIEHALLAHPAVQAAVVTVRGERFEEKSLAGYVVPAAGRTLDADALRADLASRLPAYMLPAHLLVLDALPMSANGKIDRARLPAPPARTASGKPGDAAVDGQLLDIAARLLGQPGLDMQTDLLLLGANSIVMIRLINEVEKLLGFRPDITALYRQPRLAAIAAMWADTRAARTAPDHAEHPAPLALEELRDPAARAAFKEAQHGIRADSARRAAVPLPAGDLDDLARRSARRRSFRQFDPAPLPLSRLAGLLLNLRQRSPGGQPKYLYASAGGLYPVQAYLFVKPGRVEGLAGGTYYYHPQKHALEVLYGAAELPDEIFNPQVALPVYRECAFAIFLVTQMKAIQPMYGERSAHFAAIESGLIAQLLETQAVEHALGLCQIGNVRFEPVRGWFDLDEGHQLAHTLLGGGLGREALLEVRLGRAPESLVTIQPAGTRPPIFGFHPAGGHVLKYFELAPHLGLDQPFYALKARGMEDGMPPRRFMGEMAAAYLEEIRAVQPEGPHTLLGYSVGGYVAYEIAQRLVQAGDPPPRLILIDTNAASVPHLKDALGDWRYLRFRLRKALGKARQAWWAGRGYSWRARLRLFQKARRRSIFLHDDLARRYEEMLAAVPLDPSYKALRDAQREAKLAYRIQPYPGDLVLIIADETGRYIQFAWDELVRGRCVIERVPGTHFDVLEGDNLRRVAEAIARHLPA